MATKTNKENTTENNAANEQEVTLPKTNTVKVIGACLVKLKGEKYSHGSEFELTDQELKSKGVTYLFAAKILALKDNETKTQQIIEKHRANAKPDPNEGKTTEQLESGGEFK
jgi:hypothetical protein